MSDDLSVPGAAGAPEYLEQGAGSPMPAGSPTHRSRVKPLLIGAAVVAGLGLAGAGAWVAVALSGGGAQPAAALPDTTLGYLSIDLDPSAGQKVEAFRTLRKFPAFEDAVDLGDKDDLRRELFEWLHEQDECEALDYDDDIAPWLGERAAVAAVALDEDGPQPVLVVQVKDEKKAESGLTALAACGDPVTEGSEAEWVVANGWAVVAETKDIAQGVVDGAEQGSLADDATYQKWQERVGEPGIVTMYAAPAAGGALLDLADDFGGASPISTAPISTATEVADSTSDLPDNVRSMLTDFQGMAGTLRFSDGAVELAFAGDIGELGGWLGGGGAAGDLVAGLPTDTAAAFAVTPADDWLVEMLDETGVAAEGDQTTEELLESLSAGTGLDLPEDAETLLGDGAVVAVGGAFDMETLVNSTDATGVPFGVKVSGDADAIEEVLDKLRGQLPPGASDSLASDSSGDAVAIGPSSDYRAALLEQGGLGETDTFRDVIRNSDRASMVTYVDFDAGDWLASISESDDRAAENLEPLAAFGTESWLDGDVGYWTMRVTTD